MTDKIQKPIFIVGCPRSGTTILARILDNHSLIAAGSETHFFNLLSKNKKHDWQNFDSDSIDNFFKQVRVEDFCSLLKVSLEEFKEQFSQTALDSSLSKTQANKKRVFDTMMLLLINKKQKILCCEKTPQHFNNIEEILELYPDAKIIHLLRDGRDTVNSLIKMPWRPEGLLTNSRYWKRYARKSINIIDKYNKQEKNFHCLRYEDLLQTPQESLSKLCTFLEIEFEEAMLSKSKDQTGIFSAWESSWKHKAMEELDSTRIGTWNKELDDKEKKLINWHLKDQLIALGYAVGDEAYGARDGLEIISQYTNLAVKKLARTITNIIS